MTPEEYKSAVLQEEKRHNIELGNISRDYAFSNNPHKIGDVITDSLQGHSIKIQIIQCYSTLSLLPQCKYFGTELKGNGEPKLRQRNTMIFQSRARKGAQ